MVTRGAQGFIAQPGGWAILFPGATVLADRDVGGAAACDDGAVAAAGVAGAVRGHGADLLIFGDLAQPVPAGRGCRLRGGG